jgi:hypothetical protein
MCNDSRIRPQSPQQERDAADEIEKYRFSHYRLGLA